MAFVTFAEMSGMRQEELTRRGALMKAAVDGDVMPRLELMRSYGVWGYSRCE